jgi:hypothetical protein
MPLQVVAGQQLFMVKILMLPCSCHCWLSIISQLTHDLLPTTASQLKLIYLPCSSLLYSLGMDQKENAVRNSCTVVACIFSSCWHVYFKLFHGNDHLLCLHYSGSQPLYHNILSVDISCMWFPPYLLSQCSNNIIFNMWLSSVLYSSECLIILFATSLKYFICHSYDLSCIWNLMQILWLAITYTDYLFILYVFCTFHPFSRKWEHGWGTMCSWAWKELFTCIAIVWFVF